MSGKRVNAKGRNNAGPPYVQVLKPTLQEPAWKDLNYGARCLYITLKSFYNGENNGQIFLSARKAADELGTTSLSSIIKWFRELEDHGFIKPIETGHLGVEGHGLATTWRLTELGYMREQPSRDYKNWSPKKQNPVPKNGTVPFQKMEHPVPENGTPVPHFLKADRSRKWNTVLCHYIPPQNHPLPNPKSAPKPRAVIFDRAETERRKANEPNRI
jgi:hypothetical protein